MLPLRDRPCSQPFQRYVCYQTQIPHSSYIVSLTGYEWLSRGLSLLISLDCYKLLQKIMKICWLGQWRFYVISSARPWQNQAQGKKNLFNSSCCFSSVQLSHSVMSDSLWPHEPQHARPPCPSPTPGAYSNSCPSSWLHPIKPITAAPNLLPSLSPQEKTSLVLSENFVHKATGIIGPDFCLSSFLF